ncbi:ABC transporter permease [Weissella hellenica]|uniref:ABC transporter permease n=1 Tax=Weissella hellenica TaxID=46256 RepID=A0A4Y4G6U3_WEIHE|nr:ABC transporter permease [Weissella hellenica]NKY67459.1 ABC transporter permease [Weissella hellenica]GED36595.1 ABC transporter permease [Weissella hellenica]SCC06549.1 ABC-2 type transport system permease protein [Weissella hellenica]
MSKRQLYLVAHQTYLNRFKTFGFWSVVLAPLLIVLAIVGITLIMDATQSHKQPTVAVVANQPLNRYLKQNKAVAATFKNVDSLATAKQDLKQDRIDGYLTSTPTSYALRMSVDAENLSETTLQTTIDQYHMLSQADKLHLTPNQLNSLVSKPDFQTSIYSKSGKSSQGGQATDQANQMLSAALGIFIFIFLTAYVGMISQEIANEKSSRIMEILLAVTSPGIQFFGKLLGIAGLAITHGLIYLVVVGVTAIFFGDNQFVKLIKGLLTGVDTEFAIMTGLLALVGIFLYMILTAIVSAMVNDLSQVQQAVSPITYIAMIGYILTFVLNGQPNNAFINALSYVPFISQTLMPARLGLQYANMSDAFIALALEIIVLIFLARYGLRVYKRNVLTYNDGNITKAALLSLKGLFSKKS